MQHLSKEQYSNLVHNVVKDAKLTQSGSSYNVNTVAGTILKYSASCFPVFNSSTWIIDSGASEHMCFNSKSFLCLFPLPVPLNISLTYSFNIIVTHTGSVSILPSLTLHNVLHVPDFKYNLLSVNKLCIQLNCHVLFTSSGCLLQDHSMKKERVFGDVGDGLYLLQPTKIDSGSIRDVFQQEEIPMLFLVQFQKEVIPMMFLVILLVLFLAIIPIQFIFLPMQFLM